MCRQLPAFWAWFKDSVVVDSEGRPAIMFHATDAREDFGVFDRSEDVGYHFGTIEAANERAARALSEGVRVIPVFLAIRRPLRLEDLYDWEPDNVVGALRRVNILDDRLIENASGDVIDVEWMRRVLSTAGYDGLVYQNACEGGGDSYVALWPNQIKSALSNRGSFDPQSADICL